MSGRWWRTVQSRDGTLIARVKSPPIDGRANAEAVALIARHLGLRRARVPIRSGASGRTKRIRIDD